MAEAASRTRRSAPSADAVERNGYGRVMDRMNADTRDVRHARAARDVCGIKTQSSGCPAARALHKALNSIDLEELDRNVEYDFHGYIHMLFGGAWDCKTSLILPPAAERDPRRRLPDVAASIPQYVEDVALDLNVLWRYFFFSGYLKFPDDCNATTSFEDCRGRCPSSTTTRTR